MYEIDLNLPKQIVADVLSNHEIHSVAFVGCGASMSDLYPAKYFLANNTDKLNVQIFTANEFNYDTPTSLYEAAKIDGAGHARIFFTIILRLVAPILAVITLLSFLAVTGDFLIASTVLIDPDKQTLAVGLFQYVSTDAKNYAVFAAGAVIAAILPMALFLALQRYIVGGLTAGSVK